ncbi:MAG: SusD/RagB family nutrient-binding outer membrane lipoprotein [Bacteroidetes bacterium]|nr:SusD/RagB family nutrient-binding outer membrane lipoprotein [Bacteroidota bacterium]
MKRYRLLFLILIALGMASCTDDFLEINKDPNAIIKEEASARYFITDPQYQLYAPDRYPYWRAHLIHTDRYAGYFTFGFNGSWWDGELGYSYHSGYTDAAWGWMSGYFGRIDNFLKLTEAGGDFENELMHATGRIIKGMYYQMYTDIFGEIPYSEAGIEGIVTPAYDEQKTIYQGIIAELDAAMATIGDNTVTGEGIDDLGENDLYFGGDLTKWKKLANSLKLRIGLRALGAEGAGFAEVAVTEALAAGLFLEDGEDCVMIKDDVISQWSASAYGDIWHNFGGNGSKWNLGQPLVDNLRNNNDPRLEMYALPAKGGIVELVKPAEDPGRSQFDKQVAFVKQTLTDAGVLFTETTEADTLTIDMPENMHFVGQPVRMGGDIYSYIRNEFFSDPVPEVVAAKNSGTNMWDEIIMTAAEVYFLRAEASLNGFGGTAQELYEAGIANAMTLWDVSDADIETFIATEDMAMLNGTPEQNREKVSIQRWLACYTDGFEGWAIARKSGYPSGLTVTLTDPEIHGLGTINGVYPERLRFGSGVQTQDPTNYNIVIGRQGPDRQDTKLWWAK